MNGPELLNSGPFEANGNDGAEAAQMIRIERGNEVGPGIYEYRVLGHPIFGKSRQPLLDACRQIALTVGPTKERAEIFRKGSMVSDMSCGVDLGSLATVSEPNKGLVRFAKYQKHWAAH
jgi:hypothetical protein